MDGAHVSFVIAKNRKSKWNAYDRSGRWGVKEGVRATALGVGVLENWRIGGTAE
jgi:hypothetical protein